MIALRDPKTELERPISEPVKRLEPVPHPEAADDPLVWRESDFAPVKTRGKSAAQTVIEGRG